MQNSPTITIIGAGVSGLCAAIHLKNSGYNAQLYDAAAHVGGRVATDYKDGNILDHGFQVLLDSYPAAQEFLDLESLDLIKFSPGAYLFTDGKKSTVGDPTRDPSFLFMVAFSKVGLIKDKLKIFTLSRKLKQKSLKEIFEAKEQTTLAYLQEAGFSEKIISKFFKPFYAGIFLEDELQTSSRMFEFVFKMFAQGSATLSKNGIADIPKQLAEQLPSEHIHLNQPVSRVVGSQITLADGSKLESDYTIIATQADRLVPNLPISNMKWQEVTVLYFKTEHKGFGKPIIGLVSAKNTLSNNFHFLQDVFEGHETMLSVSIVKSHEYDINELAARVRMEMKEHCKIDAGELVHSKTIHKALPDLKNLNYSMNPTETQLTQNIYLAGDQLSNGSLNAAMLNGKAAAQAVIDKIEGKVVVG
ncbi:oxidoreductase [Nonlabens sp. YIK11]|uniref:NAD(P)/FAD-dependent oxidoreductase n=1 Tax=Nonlabens sp. YIK11 TaxID=1453349 RepID=UPI0006DD112A|nr:NAD(P)/FAD-dependent oxidoreductase [Nonlabens sp. YIK11]KQC33584.1 oxidoreductase [Nonlabens sp. YIK11]